MGIIFNPTDMIIELRFSFVEQIINLDKQRKHLIGKTFFWSLEASTEFENLSESDD